jgi:mitochondrial fission protein ELM1
MTCWRPSLLPAPLRCDPERTAKAHPRLQGGLQQSKMRTAASKLSRLTFHATPPKITLMSQAATSWILVEDLAGLQAQAMGLAEAAALTPELRILHPRVPWKYITARFWPRPLQVVANAINAPLPALTIGCGGMAGAVVAALRRRSGATVQVQNPRIDSDLFDLIVANQHDELTGPNVIVTRTALHRVTPSRLAAEAERWRDRFAHLPRPLVAVLVGGSNGRFRLGPDEGAKLAADLAAMMQRDKVGVMVTPSRRTNPTVTHLLRQALTPRGAWMWNLSGDNPYFGMLALADLIVVTQDSVSMISEAVATSAPVMVAALPGRSRRQALFLRTMTNERRVRQFEGRFAPWPVAPLDDTPLAAAEMRRRIGF